MKRVKRRFVIFVVAVLLTVIVGAWCLEVRIRPAVDVAAENAAVNLLRSHTAECASFCAENGLLNELIKEVRSPSGRLEGLEVNTATVNLLRGCFANRLEELLEQRDAMTASFPLGSLTDFYGFSASGPSVKVRVFCQNSFTCRMVSDLREAGLNQSLYTLSIRVEATVQTLTGGRKRSFVFSDEVPVCQRLIVGAVPFSGPEGI